MKQIDVHQVDAFTDQLFGGNPAGVVTDADELTIEEMKKIAREMNLSETAFVLKPSSNQADVKLRFFTPTDEIKFCGHATVGALFQLAKLSMFGLGRSGTNNVRVETNAGILPMAVANKDGQPKISFTAPGVGMQPYRLQRKAFAKEFGVPTDLIRDDSTILLDKNLNYVYISVVSLKALGDQVFDFVRIREKFGKEQIVVFCFFCNETIEATSDLHARGLAPNVGIDEDPFTGSMQAGLVYAAKQNGYIDSGQQLIVTEQGNFIGRPGFAEISEINPGEVIITASAVQVFSTKMELNA
jgi:trans-2,3-dihydro-3-hydroxyanthranilate isomerase